MPTPPDFSVGQVLTAAHMDAIGLWVVKSASVGSGVTSVAVVNAFNADFDNYEITWTGGTMTSSSGDSQISLQLGPASVSGYNTSYHTTLIYNLNSTTVNGAAQTNVSSFAWAGGGSTSDAYCHFRLFGPKLARHTRYESDSYLAWNDAGFGRANGIHKSAGSFSDFTLTVTGTGTMTGGTVTVYGWNKAS